MKAFNKDDLSKARGTLTDPNGVNARKFSQPIRDCNHSFDPLAGILYGIPTLEERHTPEQEQALASDPSDEAKELLVLHSLREAFYYARKCSHGRIAEGDVLSACYLALRDAAKNFKPNQIRFFSYAKPYVRGKIIAEFRDRDIVKKCRDYEPLPDENMVDSEEDEGRSVPSACVENPDFTSFEAKDEWAVLEPLIHGVLSDKEKMILQLRYRGGLTFKQIGDLLGVSRSDTQHTHSVSLDKIKVELAKRGVQRHS